MSNNVSKAKQPITVMIVEDSATIRGYLERIINGDPRLQVIASAGSGEAAMRLLDRLDPDVISLDIRLPGMNGFEVTRRIMSEKPTPIVVCSASVESSELRITMNALRAGALSVVEKPVGQTHEDYQSLADRLCSQLAMMSQVVVIRQRWGQRPRPLGQPAGVRGDGEAMAPVGQLGQWGQPVSGLCPSGNVLLESMAKSLGRRALGIVLTGMGEDGAAGLKAIRNAGGYTIAEHASTAVVYGMPGAAERIKAACEFLPIHAVAGRLLHLVRAPKEGC